MADGVTGSKGTAVGWNSLFSLTGGLGNSAVGAESLKTNGNGHYNSALGTESLYYNTTGSYNIGVGYQAGKLTEAAGANSTTTDSIYIGYDTRASTSGVENEIAIGHAAIGKGSNTATFGNNSTTDTYLNGSTHISGSLSLPFYNMSTAYTVTAADYSIFCNASGAARTATLPTAVGIGGKIYNVKKVDSSGNACTVDGDGSETVDGATTFDINVEGESITIQSNNVGWYIL
jgi:hypothetical protein